MLLETSESITSPLAYSVPKLAELSDLSEAWLWAEIARGNLESVKIGRRRLITAEQARRYLDRHVAHSKAA